MKQANSFKHGMSRTRLERTWSGMIQRCTNPNHNRYKDWGGRGITVCDEWKISSNFYQWAMGNGYNDTLVIDREDNDGNYCPENCRFITRSLSNINRHKRHDWGVFKQYNRFVVKITRNYRYYQQKDSYATTEEAIIGRDLYLEQINNNDKTISSYERTFKRKDH